MIEFLCPTCKTQFRAADEQSGTKINCSKCGQRLMVPAARRNKTILGEPIPAVSAMSAAVVQQAAPMPRFNQRVDRRHNRRALNEEQFASFLGAVMEGKPFRGLTGQDRFFLYSFAANTGFRASELASLKPESFDLSTLRPTSTVEAAYSKHRREDKQPLRDDVADMMRGYLCGKPSGAPLWAGTWSKNAAEMVRQDLAAAGIPYEDERGRFFDFHALRRQFITMLIKYGAHPKIAQLLARHQTFAMTDAYTDEGAFDLVAALKNLPPIKKLPETGNSEEAA